MAIYILEMQKVGGGVYGLQNYHVYWHDYTFDFMYNVLKDMKLSLFLWRNILLLNGTLKEM